MAIQMSKFVQEDSISILVHFPTRIRNVMNDENSGYVLNKKYKEKISVKEMIMSQLETTDEKINQVMHIVKLDDSLLNRQVCYLTELECMKVQLAIVLLLNSKVIICEYFFDDMIFSEKEYFKRLFRNLISKKNKAIILIENDMDFVCETVKHFYLFTSGSKYKYMDNFYEDEIYQYVEMPHSVQMVKYFESKGHKIDHEITFNEVLKAIYRGVS